MQTNQNRAGTTEKDWQEERMNIAGSVLPERTQKPRSHGLTIVLDHGVPPQYFADMIAGTSRLVDLVKFGWARRS
jgi:phosphosulfolactate synthase